MAKPLRPAALCENRYYLPVPPTRYYQARGDAKRSRVCLGCKWIFLFVEPLLGRFFFFDFGQIILGGVFSPSNASRGLARVLKRVQQNPRRYIRAVATDYDRSFLDSDLTKNTGIFLHLPWFLHTDRLG